MRSLGTILGSVVLGLLVPTLLPAQEDAATWHPAVEIGLGISAPLQGYGRVRKSGPHVALTGGMPLTPGLTVEAGLGWAGHAYDIDAVRREDLRFAGVLRGGASSLLLVRGGLRLAPPTRGRLRVYARAGVGLVRLKQDALEVLTGTPRPDSPDRTTAFIIAPEVDRNAPALLLGVGLEGRTGPWDRAHIGYSIDLGLVNARFSAPVDTEVFGDPSPDVTTFGIVVGLAIRGGGGG